ncbi:short chain dehydrogenase [Virgibacillus sp. NKC19-3]|uniref:short chain dehydrogenase n=1 Tax=Virgibacillus saliphilus TaxID=2831674 RepID=UPI001C9BB9C2|nr:short chain dehydrogenase [Virgibacillus sp. NKC19-3]MBY7142427.1 short chain dehydrogenase [Virgibacillus sp. NKC19-3]
MKVLLIGATGLLGNAVMKELEEKHDIIQAARHNTDVKVDITKPDSIKRMFEQVGKVDAVISATGDAHFGPLEEITPELNETTIESKLKGQVNLVLLGMDYVNDGGSFTLTTGVIMDEPIYQGASSAMANGAVKAFTKSAATEAPRGIRINSVSPSVFQESPEGLQAFFPGFEAVPLSKVALAFRKSVEGVQTGQSYEIY